MYITEEHKEKIGEYIKFIREEMDLTQGELSGEDKAVEFYICSKKQLSNIEQGKNIPSLPVLTRLLGRLGKSIEDLATYINDGEKIKFNNEYEIIGELIHKGNYEEAKIKYDKLKELPYHDKKDKKYLQILIYLEGIFCRYLEKDLETATEFLKNAIILTKPKTFLSEKKGKATQYTNNIDTRYIKENVFSLVEYKILFNFASLKKVYDKREEAIDINYSIIESFKNKTLDRNIKNKVFHAVYFNLSNVLIDEERYIETIKICTEAINWLIEIKSNKTLSELYLNRGEAFISIGDRENGEKDIKIGYDYIIQYEDFERAEKIKDIAKKEFGISIC